MSKMEVEQCNSTYSNTYDFLNTARTPDGFVKGTGNAPFPRNGPPSKYHALFDNCPCFSALRDSFFLTNLEDSARLVANIPEANALANILREMLGVRSRPDEPENFAERAWPYYRKAVKENKSYYLSVNELMVICAVQKRNLMIFKKENSKVRFLAGKILPEFGGHIYFAMLEVDQSLKGNSADLRGHYSKLIATSDADVLQRKTKAESEDRQAKAQRRQEAWLRQQQLQREKQTENKGSINQSSRQTCNMVNAFWKDLQSSGVNLSQAMQSHIHAGRSCP